MNGLPAKTWAWLIGMSALVTVVANVARPEGPAPGAQEQRPWALKEFAEVRQLVKPAPGENLWDRVRWMPTLWEAHERAVEEGKPIVIFASGGEPLGVC
jgi:hypothetical protein